MKKIMFFMILGFSVVVFNSCNVYNQIHSTTEPNVNFTQYKTFAWLMDKADTANSPYNNEIIRNNMRNYFSKELSDRGYQVNTEQPDLLLELEVKNEPHVLRHVYREDYYYNRYFRHSSYYSPFERHYYYARYPNYSYSNPYRRVIVDSHINNSVTLNIVDAKAQKLVWTGTVEADIYAPSVIQHDIHPAVVKLMKQFPVKPIKGDAKATLAAK